MPSTRSSGLRSKTCGGPEPISGGFGSGSRRNGHVVQKRSEGGAQRQDAAKRRRARRLRQARVGLQPYARLVAITLQPQQAEPPQPAARADNHRRLRLRIADTDPDLETTVQPTGVGRQLDGAADRLAQRHIDGQEGAEKGQTLIAAQALGVPAQRAAVPADPCHARVHGGFRGRVAERPGRLHLRERPIAQRTARRRAGQRAPGARQRKGDERGSPPKRSRWQHPPLRSNPHATVSDHARRARAVTDASRMSAPEQCGLEPPPLDASQWLRASGRGSRRSAPSARGRGTSANRGAGGRRAFR